MMQTGLEGDRVTLSTTAASRKILQKVQNALYLLSWRLLFYAGAQLPSGLTLHK